MATTPITVKGMRRVLFRMREEASKLKQDGIPFRFAFAVRGEYQEEEGRETSIGAEGGIDVPVEGWGADLGINLVRTLARVGKGQAIFVAVVGEENAVRTARPSGDRGVAEVDQSLES